MTADLRNRALPSENRVYLSTEKKRVEDEIARLVGRRKQLEADVLLKKKHVTEKKKKLQKIQGEKTKINTPVSAEIENILLQHNISAAAYHGGKLNGVNCREFIRLAKQIFPIFKLIFSPRSTQIDALMM
jgi:ABC-type cobalt transport system substrate-binding protein